MSNVDLLEDMQNWVLGNFPDTVTIETEYGFYSQIPDLYRIAMPKFGLKSVFAAVAGKDIRLVHNIESLGETRDKSLQKLFIEMAGSVRLNATMAYFLPKNGQNLQLATKGGTFELIDLDHKRHNHSALDVLDFSPIQIDPRIILGDMTREVIRTDFDDAHVHLRHLKFFG